MSEHTLDQDTETTNHGIIKPATGSTDWQGHFYDFADLVDQLLADAGPASGMDSSYSDGAFYLATDENILYQYDEATDSWNDRAGIGTSTSPVPAMYADDVHATNVNADQLTGHVDASDGIYLPKSSDDTVDSDIWIRE